MHFFVLFSNFLYTTNIPQRLLRIQSVSHFFIKQAVLNTWSRRSSWKRKCTWSLLLNVTLTKTPLVNVCYVRLFPHFRNRSLVSLEIYTKRNHHGVKTLTFILQHFLDTQGTYLFEKILLVKTNMNNLFSLLRLGDQPRR